MILLVAGQALQAGTLTVGDFALFLSYLAWLTQMTGFFGNFVTKIRQVGVSFDRAAALVQDGALPGAPARRRRPKAQLIGASAWCATARSTSGAPCPRCRRRNACPATSCVRWRHRG